MKGANVPRASRARCTCLWTAAECGPRRKEGTSPLMAERGDEVAQLHPPLAVQGQIRAGAHVDEEEEHAVVVLENEIRSERPGPDPRGVRLVVGDPRLQLLVVDRRIRLQGLPDGQRGAGAEGRAEIPAVMKLLTIRKFERGVFQDAAVAD